MNNKVIPLYNQIILAIILLFSSLCICCDGCGNKELIDDESSAHDITITSIDGSKKITKCWIGIDSKICDEVVTQLMIKTSSKKSTFNLENLSQIKLRIKDKENIKKLMYVSSGKKTKVSDTKDIIENKVYDTLPDDVIDMTKFLAVHELDPNDKNYYINSSIIAILDDYNKPFSLTFDLEIDGKSIEKEPLKANITLQYNIGDYVNACTTLGILPKDATETTVKKAKKKLALKYHPDKWEYDPHDPTITNINKATAKCQEINNAYDILKECLNFT